MERYTTYVMRLKFTSLNLQGFESWDQRSPEILDYLTKTDPDAILFQEAVFLPDVSPHNQAQLLNQTLHYPYQLSTISRLQPSSNYASYREGLAVLSKHPITSSDTIILKKEEGDEHNRILQMTDIMVGATVVRLANIHFSITDNFDYATPHLKETLAILKARHEKRILLGDFNLTHLEDSAPLWENDYVSSADTPYITYPSKHKRTDYALVPKELGLRGIYVSGDGLSDHRALTIEVDIP